VQHKQLNKMLV